ncbi:MAG TPA: preprotein translocase subunit YajC [Anaeromyxobacteraceae bacterium]|nr:preprotein translocase subunit YajC [Anaeromyxobacteraceae bacterium]
MHSILTAFLGQTGSEPGQANPLLQLLPFVLIAVVFYLVFFRPQQKQMKKHQEFVGQLQKGQDVVTNSGIIGKVFQVDDRTVTLDVGGGTKIRFLKAQVAATWSEKGEAEKDAKEKK